MQQGHEAPVFRRPLHLSRSPPTGWPRQDGAASCPLDWARKGAVITGSVAQQRRSGWSSLQASCCSGALCNACRVLASSLEAGGKAVPVHLGASLACCAADGSQMVLPSWLPDDVLPEGECNWNNNDREVWFALHWRAPAPLWLARSPWRALPCSNGRAWCFQVQVSGWIFAQCTDSSGCLCTAGGWGGVLLVQSKDTLACLPQLPQQAWPHNEGGMGRR